MYLHKCRCYCNQCNGRWNSINTKLKRKQIKLVLLRYGKLMQSQQRVAWWSWLARRTCDQLLLSANNGTNNSEWWRERPKLCGCPRCSDLLLSPKRLVLVAQTSCRPNDRTPYVAGPMAGPGWWLRWRRAAWTVPHEYSAVGMVIKKSASQL